MTKLGRTMDKMPTDESAFSAALGEDLRPPKLSHLVASRLRRQIISGALKPGSMLLPESKMLAIFNVSRPTLREALRILEAEALISIGRGARSGATVLGPNIQKATEYATTILVHEGVTMRELHEARMYVEPAILRSLEGRPLKEATVHLRECINTIEQALRERRYLDVLSGTNRFHEELARASGNKAIAVLIGMLQTISDDAYAVNLSSERSSSSEALERNMAKTVTGYATLCDLLEKGKTEEAASFWRRYMERAMEFLIRSKIGERRLVLSDSGAAQRTAR